MSRSRGRNIYSRIPEEETGNKVQDVPLRTTCTFGWVTSRLGLNQKSCDEFVPGQHSTWQNSENMRRAWIKREREAFSRETDPQLWKAVLSFISGEEYMREFLLLIIIASARILQPTMFAAVLSSEPVMLYGSPLPWICVVTAGYWLAVSSEGLARSHYSFCTHLTSTSVKSGLSGLLYEQVLRLKETDLADYTTSHLINLISKDLEPIDQCSQLVPFLFTAPVELVVFSILLSVLIGWESVMGIVYMLVCTLLRCGIGRVYKKLRQHTVFFMDHRLRLLSEILSGIRAIKINAWEGVFKRLIKDVRRKELHHIKRKALVLGSLLSVQHAVPIISSLVSIATLSLRGKDLNAINMFLTILTMYILDSSCGESFVKGVEALVRTLARLRRIEQFLLLDFPVNSFVENTTRRPEHRLNRRGRSHSHSDNVTHHSGISPSDKSPYLSLRSVCCEGEYGLTDIELNYITCSFEGPQLVTITGPPKAGAGTSLLLGAILKEVPLIQGSVVHDGKIAYVGQKPWIFSGTLRENILFGDPYNEERFLAVITACKLGEDVAVLPSAENTYIGEGGSELTLGQRQRINLARAAYSTASIILLDDPVSHLDTLLANQIFDDCIEGFLAPRLKLLVTRRELFLARSPRVLFMTNGIIVREGSFAKIRESGDDLSWLSNSDNEKESEEKAFNDPQSKRTQSVDTDPDSDETNENEGFTVYLTYAKQAGFFPLLLVIGLILVPAPGAILAALGLWFARISGLSLENQQDLVHFYTATVLVGAFLLLLLIRASFLFLCGLRSSKRIHKKAISSLLKAPVQLFEADKQGKLLKTFSKDVECLDEKLPLDILRFLHSVIEHIAAVIIIKITTPWAILAAVPAAIILLLLGRYYLCLERRARNLESRSLNLFLTHFSDTIAGAVTIRAYQKEINFENEFHRLYDQYTTAVCTRSAAEQWLALRHLLVTSLFMCLATVIVIFTSDITLVALSLTYDRQLVVGIALIPILFTDIEQGMVSTARLFSYFDLHPEVGYDNITNTLEDWPSKGSVSVSDDIMAHTPRRRVSFQTLTLYMAPGEKILVIGERNASKIYLVDNMLLLNESRQEVLVDEIALKLVNLQKARRVFSVVQREAFVFTASLRTNLDPEGIHEDKELWSALEAVQMKDYVQQLSRQLDYIMTQPSFFTYSQLVLLAIARVLLQMRRIVIFDEIMSNVNLSTLRIIRNVLKKQLGYCTVITVEYKPISLETVLCYDRVVVMEGGRIVEMDDPRALLERQDSLLSAFLMQS